MNPTLLTLRNDALEARIHPDGSLALTDRATHRLWTTWPVAIQEDNEIDVGHVWLRTGRSLCEQYPARFTATLLRADGDTHGVLRLTVLGREALPAGQFTATFTLANDALEVSLSDIDESLPSLSYPPGFRDADELILPQGVGRRIRKGTDDRRILTFWAHLNLRMWGLLRATDSSGGGGDTPDAGLLAEFAHGHADAALSVTRKIAAPVWLKSLGRWATGADALRTVRYRFTRGGYVGLAKAYRRAMEARAKVTTLTEKLARFPQLANLLHGRHVSFMLGRTVKHHRAIDTFRDPDGEEGLRVDLRYADVRRILTELRAAGLGKALVMLRGWIAGGYDESHPDIWPPDPAFGTVDELADLCKARGLGDGFTPCLHDNYQDIYLQSPSWPNGVIRDRHGRAMQGGYWAGGQAYILNARDSLNYLRRNWPHLASLGAPAFFPDTTTAVQLYQSYEPGNTTTRAQDEALKLDLLRFVSEQGVLVGSEESAEFGLPHVGWLENRHKRVPGESIPLWPLVTHDLVANGRYGNAYYADPPIPAYSPNPATETDAAPAWTVEMLWGYFILMSLGTWGSGTDKVVEALRRTRHVDDHFAAIATAPMTAHRYLTPDATVEQTEFATGRRVTVNFGKDPYSADGLSLAPGAWHVEG